MSLLGPSIVFGGDPRCPSAGPVHSELFPPTTSLGPSIIFGVRPRCPSIGQMHSDLFPPMSSLGRSIDFGGQPRWPPPPFFFFLFCFRFGTPAVRNCMSHLICINYFPPAYFSLHELLWQMTSPPPPRCPSIGPTDSEFLCSKCAQQRGSPGFT